MSLGAIVVSFLYEKFLSEMQNPEIYDFPIEIAEYDSSRFTLEEQSVLLNKTIILWNSIESHFHILDDRIHYHKDDEAAELFFKCVGHFYAFYYNKQIHLFSDILLDCRRESLEQRWTEPLIQMYSKYYLMRQNLISHIRYLYNINPRLVGCTENDSKPDSDTDLRDPNFQKTKVIPKRTFLDYLYYGIWKFLNF